MTMNYATLRYELSGKRESRNFSSKNANFRPLSKKLRQQRNQHNETLSNKQRNDCCEKKNVHQKNQIFEPV